MSAAGSASEAVGKGLRVSCLSIQVSCRSDPDEDVDGVGGAGGVPEVGIQQQSLPGRH